MAQKILNFLSEYIFNNFFTSHDHFHGHTAATGICIENKLSKSYYLYYLPCSFPHTTVNCFTVCAWLHAYTCRKYLELLEKKC